ncbi:MAG: carboxypeptidase-like regulatory domain-containing protein [Vicinamibacterales bacterium]
MFRHSPAAIHRFVETALLVALLLTLSSPARAQSVSGTLLGTVTDSSGAVISKAKVTVINEGTGLTRTVEADSNGDFSVPSIPTGRYTVTAEMSGFKTLALSNVEVGVDQRVRIDLKLEVGAMTESVTVEAVSPLVQTSSSELGTTVDDQQIEALPLNGRNFVSLTRTVPGVLRGIPGSNIDGAGSLAWRASAAFSANGQRPRDNNFMLDGVDNNETWLQTVVIFPSVDALDEFKLQTSTYSAEFGRSLGGVVNLQIKSGTNSLRGSAFEFHRNDAFDANNFFNNRAGRDKPDFKQNQFGGTVGGALLRDRTFFFGSYQGHRETQGQTFLSTVPTLAMRGGNFSELNRVIYDPQTGQPFPGNIIPNDRIDSVARSILTQLYPEPNTAGTRQANGQTISNYLINPIKERQDNQFDVKVDHNLSSSNRFFTRYSFQKTHRLQPATLPHGDAGATFGAGDGNIKGQSLAFNDTQTLGSRWLNEFRFGWSSIKFLMTPIDYGTNPAQAVGLPGINLNEVTSAMTQMTFQNIRNLGANGNQPLITNQNDFQIFDNVTWSPGRHTLKMGGSITFRSREILNADSIVGNFSFNNNMTSNCAGQPAGCTVNSSTGFDVASFMLGLVNVKSRNMFDAGTYTEKRPEISTYIQDDFRLSHRLTLNMGLRWDVYPPWVEIEDRQSNFDESTGRFVVASPNAVINGVEVGRYLQTYSKRDVGPRFGFAYDLAGDGKTVVRGGFGVFWNFSPGGTSSSKAQNPPFLQSTTLNPSPTAYGSNLLLKDGLPPPPGVDPNRPAAGSTRSIFDINFRDAYARQWNLNIQRGLATNYMLELAYVGSQGRQMMLKGDPNQAPPVVGVTDANVNRPYARISPALRTIGQTQSKGTLDYHGLLVKFQRRFANNFSFLNSYTWGKAIDLNSDNDGTVTLTNVYDPQYNRGPADYDIKHTFSSSWIYELPWARNALYGGWQVTGILLLRSGLPLTVTQSQGVQSTGTGNRPNRICDGKLSNPTIDRWFDAACFAQVPDVTGTYGDAGRGIIRGPGSFNIDASIIKNTRIGRYQTEIRIEAFNLLNHPQFANPNTTIGNAAVGTITAMLSNPSCSLCGTTERQVQLGVKVRF